MFERKQDVHDYFVSLSLSFLTSFSWGDYEEEKAQLENVKRVAPRLYKNDFLLKWILDAAESAFASFDQGLRPLPSVMTKKAAVFWKWESPCPKKDIIFQEKLLPKWPALWNEIAIIESEILSGYWSSKRWPKAVRARALKSIDVQSERAEEALFVKMRELIDEAFDLLFQGDELGALAKIHLAGRHSYAIQWLDHSALVRTAKPWDMGVLPDEPWIIGV